MMAVLVAVYHDATDPVGIIDGERAVTQRALACLVVAGSLHRSMHMTNDRKDEGGRIGYFVLYLMGVPLGVLLLLWALLGDNLIGRG